jgi:hypothetical protein
VNQPADPYSDASSASPDPAPNPNARSARSVTDPLRQVAASALLAGNAVFLFLGVSDLLLVVSGWATGFGARSETAFDQFAGPLAVALPLLAMLVATHLAPPLAHTRAILLVALAEYAVSAVFGVITYLGAFANGLFLVRATFDGLLGRAVWLAFLTIAAAAVYRVYRALYPSRPRPTAYSYGPTVYGRPYPGQPSYPRPTNYHGSPAEAGAVYVPTAETATLPPVPAVPSQPSAPVTAPPLGAPPQPQSYLPPTPVPAPLIPAQAEPPAEPTRPMSWPGGAPEQ